MKVMSDTGPTRLKILLAAMLFCCCYSANGQRLNPFLSSTSQVANGPGVELLPYENTFSVFDGIPAESSQSTKEVCFYMTLPGSVNELGIRLIAPAPSYYHPFPGDVVAPCFENKEFAQISDMDPQLVLEYALYDDSTTAFVPGKKIIAWVDAGAKPVITENFASGSSNGKSVVIRSIRNWNTELIRLTFRDKKGKKASGSFLLQTGTVPGLKGIRLKRSIDALRAE